MRRKRNHWPVSLYWLPSGGVIPLLVSLGTVSSSFLDKRRSRSGQSGCLITIEQSPRGSGQPMTKENVPTHPDVAVEGCQASTRLRRKARTCLKFLQSEFRLKRARALPSRIECGHLRSAIRSCFDDLSEVVELSIKTSQKLEKSFCPSCESTTVDMINKWKEERFQTVNVEEDHIRRFTDQVRRNVVPGWNRGKWAFVPNGHACLGRRRREGGNWIVDPVSDEVRAELVVSSGKPRIITVHSSGVTEILYPLHKALYSSLKRWGWLLVGDPTNEQVASLNGRAYISVDYSSATDNIKTAYTRAAIEVLIDKGEGLTDEECSALRSVGRLRIDGSEATRGQPMGSMMSFPLLCLINKVVVDLALNDLLIEGKISFKEWTSHRCLINGDDLLLRDVGCGGLLDKIKLHGYAVGLVINESKTMVHTEKGEINSTLFVNGVRQRKVNLGALYMGREVNDVIGFANRSSRTVEGFLTLARRAKDQLSRQEVKLQEPLSCRRFNALVRDKGLRESLCATSVREPCPNPFGVVSKPDGYDLTRDEEVVLIRERVNRLRSEGYVPPRDRAVKIVMGPPVSLRKALKRNNTNRELTLACLADGWKEKRYKTLQAETFLVDCVPTEHVCDECSSGSQIQRLMCRIKEVKGMRGYCTAVSQSPGCRSPSGDFVAL
ncbi:RNA-dependent RNA polymerase [Pyricularia oryzae ourmia-like virus 1]|uniref:RNA-dependent RNA polymerase n=1 Tax=Pyricularia oryzae ourmia-like virus 1 TaxID=2291940 RepID=A0A3T0ZCP3_9VIRU|nr:RNA-dependent RNA polymerase [Pyricularia oryzae ourmia-like virus 1]BBF90576.1 RNA-dependent RNA polymerase [Pyricularia oryzae ourmia-like virus 1]